MKDEPKYFPFYSVKFLLPQLLPGRKNRRYNDALKRLKELGIPFRGQGTNHIVLTRDIEELFQQDSKTGNYVTISDKFKV